MLIQRYNVSRKTTTIKTKTTITAIVQSILKKIHLQKKLALRVHVH